MMVDFASILKEIREESLTQKEKGTRFERLIRDYLATSAKYRAELEKVWLWEDFPCRKDMGGKDLGIDLVAKTVGGEYWAIQCKCYAEDATVSKVDVDSFLSNSSRSFYSEMTGREVSFSARYWIATMENWGGNAWEVLQNQKPPVTCLYTSQIAEDTTVDWDALRRGLYGKNAEIHEPHKLRPHQDEALKNAHAHYQNHDRGKMIMACGTGKTFTSLRLVERETNHKGLILVLVPSIALINQTLNEWCAQAEHDIYSICVCSDRTASRKRDKNGDDDESRIDLALPACTNFKSVAAQLEAARKNAENMIVVYSTYQSIDVVSKAQKWLMGELVEDNDLFTEKHDANGDFTFDFIICDEAHRTTGIKQKDGKDESAFTKVHDNEFLHAKKRLYMTATPRLYAEAAKKKAEEKDLLLCSMDDVSQYGEEFYRIGFGEAVEKGLLSDYKVLILTVPDNTPIPVDLQAAIRDKAEDISADDAIKIIGCVNALSKRVAADDNNKWCEVDPGLMHRAVAFCQNIRMSQMFAESFEKYGEKIKENLADDTPDKTVCAHARHVDGSMDAGTRNDRIAWLKQAPQDGKECRILTNVRCLSEGVDVPSLDAILFLSSRNSQVDVVQSVGRVMRKANKKRYGYIVIPVVVPAEESPEDYLDDSRRYAVIWTVLNALRAHDDRFNAIVNQIDLNEKKPDDKIVIGPGPISNPNPGGSDGDTPPGPSPVWHPTILFPDELSDAIYARMVTKVGSKRYWTQWAEDVAKIAETHTRRIRQLLSEDKKFREEFAKFMDGLHRNINPNITEETATGMLSQHMVTRPVFEALFENYSFAEHNPISQAMKGLMTLIDETAYEKDQRTLDRFYQSVKDRCAGIDNAQGKQKVIIELYDTFFKVALKSTVEKLGVVYTPVEVVDFINQSVADVLKKEFGRTLSDENIHIIDPFTGTGTFITRLIQSGLIKKEDLPRKYADELHANELILLAYYIASINIENAYHDAAGETAGTYTPFAGICLTDTFQLYEDRSGDMERLNFPNVLQENSERVMRQTKVPVRVIIGNPPYSVGQKSANDNAQNEHYEKLERRIEETYAAGSSATNKNALYDSYIKAFRYASDFLDEKNGGVIGFVTNAGWLDGNAMDGFRKCLETEFSSIYIYHLRGNQRTSGELSRKEGGKIFGSGSRAPIAITVLVKNPKAKKEKADIYYRELDDYMTREQKLAAVAKQKSVLAKGFTQKVIHPNEAGDWINQRSDAFGTFIPIQPEKKFDETAKTFFNLYSQGLGTSRDVWVYNFSEEKAEENIGKTVKVYNRMVKTVKTEDKLDRDPKHIAWSSSLIPKWKAGHEIKPNFTKRIAMYRPFSKQNLIWQDELIHRKGQWKELFPTPEHENLVICINGAGSSKELSVLISDCIVDLHMNGDTQCFPLYWYEKDDGSGSLFDAGEETYKRHDAVTDFILGEVRARYETESITREDIFYFVYGFLHSPAYRSEFAADLKKMLPRLPLPETLRDFVAFSKAGRSLARLHLAYESQKPPAAVTVTARRENDRVEKMRFRDKTDKSTLCYNDDITISGIPLDAYEYVVNGKSAIEWIMERYQIKTDKDSGIQNDPNDWTAEHGDPKYILNLLLSVIAVSVESVKIIRSLPEIKKF